MQKEIERQRQRERQNCEPHDGCLWLIVWLGAINRFSLQLALLPCMSPQTLPGFPSVIMGAL